MKYRSFPFLLLFISLSPFLFSQQTLYVEEWVQKPSEKELEKPIMIIDFWATYCGPCLQAMPETERLMQNFTEDVILIYTSEEPSLTVQRFMEKKGKHFVSAVDNKGRNIDLFTVGSLPTSFILDPEGNVLWRGFPTDITPSLLQNFIRKFKGKKASPYRVSLDEPKEVIEAEVFEDFKSKGISINFTESITESFILEDAAPDFYFNGNLVNLISFLYDMPEKNIENFSDNQQFYTLSCQYDNREKFKKALEKFIKNQLNINIDKDAKMMESYVLTAEEKTNFFDTSMYDFSESKAKYLASDMDIEIDNASVNEMVQILNKFSEYHFEADGFDTTPYDWNIHFKYNQLTTEQLENDYHFTLKKEKRLVEDVIIQNR